MKVTVMFSEGGEEIPNVHCTGEVCWDDNATQAHDVWDAIRQMGKAAMAAAGFSAQVISEVTGEGE